MYKVGDYTFRDKDCAIAYASNIANSTGIIIAVEYTAELPVDTILL